MDPFAPNRKKLEQDLLDVVIAQAAANQLTEETAQPIAQFVLDRIDKLQNQDQAVQFLEALALQWPIFNQILEIERGKLHRKVEIQAAQNIAQLVKSGNPKDAIDMATKVMRPSVFPKPQQPNTNPSS